MSRIDSILSSAREKLGGQKNRFTLNRVVKRENEQSAAIPVLEIDLKQSEKRNGTEADIFFPSANTAVVVRYERDGDPRAKATQGYSFYKKFESFGRTNSDEAGMLVQTRGMTEDGGLVLERMQGIPLQNRDAKTSLTEESIERAVIEFRDLLEHGFVYTQEIIRLVDDNYSVFEDHIFVEKTGRVRLIDAQSNYDLREPEQTMEVLSSKTESHFMKMPMDEYINKLVMIFKAELMVP